MRQRNLPLGKSANIEPIPFRCAYYSGSIGLPGAFLEAGVQSVLVSIPPADDIAMYRFMVLYHQNRLEGKPPLSALQITQNAMEKALESDISTLIGFTVYGCW